MFNESCPVPSPSAATYTATNAATLAMDDAVSKMTVPAVYSKVSTLNDSFLKIAQRLHWGKRRQLGRISK